MRSFDPTEEYDVKDLQRLKAEPWMVDLLNVNPEYVWWGPHEDYMWKDGTGWDSVILIDSWEEMFGLDDLNEVVNFYFEVERSAEKCTVCDGTGLHPDGAFILDETFYGNLYRGLPTMRKAAELGIEYGWKDHLTQDELEALQAQGRVSAQATLANLESHLGIIGHDAINRMILVRTRAERMGLPYHCDVCEGHGANFVEEAAHVNLVLWVLHPRKGASRGVEIKNIQREQLPDIQAFLQEAARRNADRFSRVVDIC